MKKVIISFIIVFAFSALVIDKANAQCRQQMVYSCATDGIQSIFLRDFNTKLRNVRSGETGTKWTVVLNKDARYRFNLCTPDGFENDVVLTLYDSQHPEETNPYGSTYDKKTGKDHKSFDFVCKKSGMYYVSIRFKPDSQQKKTCAVGILSFVSSGGE